MPETAIGPVTCAGCGLLCDDVRLDLSGDAVRLTPECGLGARWFTDRARRPADTPGATIDGRPAEVDAALAHAAQLLRGARRPLVHGFEDSTVEDARAAVALADRLGALVVTEDVDGPWPGAPALPLRGSTTATLGEIRDRSRVVVIWREDPETTHPRLLERLGFARDVPRILIVVDDRDTPTVRRADVRVGCPPELALEALVTLHALIQAPPTAPAPGEVEEQMRTVLEHIEAVPHVAFVYGAGLTGGEGGQRRALALHELSRALSHDRHVVTLALARAAGSTGAQDALAWQTGYAGNVDFAGGHPEQHVGTHPTEDVDVALGVGGAVGSLPKGAVRVTVGSEPGPEPVVWIRTASPGVEAAGTAHRLDGVPLTLQAPLASDAPTAAAVLERLLAEVGR